MFRLEKNVGKSDRVLIQNSMLSFHKDCVNPWSTCYDSPSPGPLAGHRSLRSGHKYLGKSRHYQVYGLQLVLVKFLGKISFSRHFQLEKIRSSYHHFNTLQISSTHPHSFVVACSSGMAQRVLVIWSLRLVCEWHLKAFPPCWVSSLGRSHSFHSHVLPADAASHRPGDTTTSPSSGCGTRRSLSESWTEPQSPSALFKELIQCVDTVRYLGLTLHTLPTCYLNTSESVKKAT